MRLSYVVQRYGREVYAGAENHCRMFCERLAARGVDVEVLTTCAVDYRTWANALPEGESIEGGVRVHRFPVVRERSEHFDAFSLRVLTEPTRATRQMQEDWMQFQGPQSPALVDALHGAKAASDLVVFFTYLYYPTYYGLRVAGDRGVLHPTAHDEPPIYLPIFDEMFRLPRAFVFSSEEEARLVRRRFGVEETPSLVAGVGVGGPEHTDPDRGRAALGLEGPYLLYLGRVDEAKGCKHLCEWFAAYKERHPGPLQLVLIGDLHYRPPTHPDIRCPGSVDDETKWDLLAGAELLVHPSFWESFSMVLLEAWSVGTPALVNGLTDVLVGLCRRSGGGVWYRSYAEFEAALVRLLGDPGTRERLGGQGRAYALTEYNWDTVISRYLAFLERQAAG